MRLFNVKIGYKPGLVCTFCLSAFALALFAWIAKFGARLSEEGLIPSHWVEPRCWLFPILYGIGGFAFAGIVLFFFNEFLFKIDISVIEAEREYVKRMRASGILKAMVLGGMMPLGISFLCYDNLLGVGVIVLTHGALSLFDQRYWE